MSGIRVESLVKEFRRPKRFDGPLGGLRTLVTRQSTVHRAVDGIDFEIEPGELVAYLGPNGAGKSTTIKMLTGVLVPTSGTVEVGGLVPWRDRRHNAKQIGVVFGQRSQLWWDLPLRDSLRLVGRLYEMPEEQWRERVGYFIELLGMGEFIDQPVRQLSLGQRMRGDLAAAMLYGPRILYLDEPTVGLDVMAKDQIRTFIREVNEEQGTTVILTTHDLDDVERLCSRALLIDHGRLLYDGDLDTLKAKYAPHRELVVKLAEPRDVVVTGAEQVAREDMTVRLRFDPAILSAAELIREVLTVFPVKDLSLEEPGLDGVVRAVYADSTAAW